ncbi:MAG: CoA transferase [Candidatus Binatia bacterium]
MLQSTVDAQAPTSNTQHPAPNTLPLQGIRVADFSWAWAGPFCAMHLAHLGAEVIRIESNVRLDLGRRVPIYPTGMQPGLNRSGYFNQWHQGKKSILLTSVNAKPSRSPENSSHNVMWSLKTLLLG